MIVQLGQSVGVVAFAFVVAYVLIVLTREGESQDHLPPSVYDDKIAEIDAVAVDEAYKKHIILLFDNWVKDVKGQPGRAMKGAGNARRAYIDSMTAIDERRNKTK